ncbi:ATP-binding protein [Candidatus Methylopumilus universalis]|jgi:anti-sigma regulatory factor (Ser/Thr protein kinase)|uniref:ATP-binding protein n=1 Tax=Candidatus Methylopumilus TaxID=1679002 RepID=UPI00111EA6F3|nr:ATP-binding protein [Candidatus Methylopumilus universalis]QDC98363.1 ATP-binding protein [Candidatus Methylopumilus universalis]
MKALKINLTKNISDLTMLVTKLEKFFEENNISSISMPMTLILEELYTNTITHGASDGRDIFIEVNLGIDKNELVMTYKDNGIPFNVLELPGPDLTASIENREVGGLGVHYVKTLTDSVEYEYLEKQNVLKMKKKLSN